MDGKTLVRIGAVVFVGVAITAAVVELTRDDSESPLYRTLAPPADLTADLLRPTLRQCRDMGEAALHDDGCRKIWIKARDRFLGRRDAPFDKAGEAPATLFPTTPTIAAPARSEPPNDVAAPSSSGGR